jgi:L-iditol 2-dehydrogenase
MSNTIRATRISGPGVFEFISVDAPRPGAAQVLIRPLKLSLCGSDIFMLHYERETSYPRKTGTTGHEMVGVVEELGEGVTNLKTGTIALVLAPNHDAMAELFVAEAEWILPLPQGRSIQEYLMAQQLGTVIFACRRLPSVVDKKVAIVGQGSAGLFFAAFLRRLGASRVIVMDIVPDRLTYADQFGADIAIDNRSVDPVKAVEEFTNGEMVDLVIEAAGEVDSINLAPKLVRVNGTILFFGIPHSRSFPFDYWDFFRRYATTITCSGAMLEPGKGSFKLALDLIETGAIDVTGIVTHSVPFERVAEAYELARLKNDGAVKVVVSMPRSET